LALLVALAGTGSAAREQPLTNADVVTLTEAGLGPAAIVAKIERSETTFDTTVTALVSLARKGIADKVLEAMVAAGGPAPATETHVTREPGPSRPGGASEVEPRTGRPPVEEDYYLAVATSPPAGSRFGPDERGHFGIGWHAESHHDAGKTAVAECVGQGGGGHCAFNASGTSLRGGCVGLARASWYDRGEDAERTYVVASSSFRNVIAGQLRSACEVTVFGGKSQDTVVEHSCDVLRVMCAEDVKALARTPEPLTSNAATELDGRDEFSTAARPHSPTDPGSRFREALRSGGEGPEMVVIPAGRFRMGCSSSDDHCFNEERPVHEVTIPAPFALSVHEVTFEDYDRFSYPYKVDDEGWGRGRRPVINVSWNDAMDYVEWLSAQTGAEYRLPSEAEWEYAARAGASTRYSWGNEIGMGRANCSDDDCGDRWEYTAPVGSFARNAFGLYDMHGNVREWVADCVNGSYAGAPSDGSAWLSGNCALRVQRDGAWYHYPGFHRVSHRTWWGTDDRNVGVGFRVARTLAP